MTDIQKYVSLDYNENIIINKQYDFLDFPFERFMSAVKGGYVLDAHSKEHAVLFRFLYQRKLNPFLILFYGGLQTRPLSNVF